MISNEEREREMLKKALLNRAEWRKIYLRWRELMNDAGAVKTLQDEFGCSCHKVMNAISWGLKYGEKL